MAGAFGSIAVKKYWLSGGTERGRAGPGAVSCLTNIFVSFSFSLFLFSLVEISYCSCFGNCTQFYSLSHFI